MALRLSHGLCDAWSPFPTTTLHFREAPPLPSPSTLW